MNGEDASAYLADFGVPCRFGEVSATVILDMPDANVLGDRAQSTNYLITFLAAELPGLDHGSLVDVDGEQYSVITVSNIDDGVFKTAALQRV